MAIIMIISILQSKNKTDICLTSEAVSVLVQNHHTVLVEGEASRQNLKNYLNVGAYIINAKEELLDRGDLILKKTEPKIKEIDYLNGENKIFVTKIKPYRQNLFNKILEHKISIINYSDLKGFRKKHIDINIKVEFSNYILPFLLSLADKGLKALVDDEKLRQALLIMHGKVYNNKLAALYKMPCYEF